MATITLGLGAAGAVAAGAAVAGLAGAVTLAGLALAGRRRGRGRRFRGGRRRFGRAVAEESAAVERIMALIREEDDSGCARRMVCELGRRAQETLSEEEKDILDLVGPGVPPGQGVLPEGASWEYRAVRGLGEAGGNCGHAFPTCTLGGAQLMSAVTAYLP
ncbi:uncharacterized protein LOC123512811 [Portunus trituberculatus]|uniref:Uncharacterized protein n=1 Tax=Portunus trituberculatus TaxID=210409 RepID=A0A5B7FD63_PORTR|nr:uncharacterized protein LOC123512811 [Portunus trituberculatus]MPC44392.1 hypothetical protein [Portunus trituberculatus]